MVECKIDHLVNVVNSFSVISSYLVFFLGFLLINGVWLVVTTMSVNVWENEGMLNSIKKVVLVFIFIMIR